MVKIVRDFVPKTRFLILCDASCCNLIVGEGEPISDEQRAAGIAEQVEGQQMRAFVSASIQQGWTVGLDRQLCPQHVQKEAGESSRILIPHGRFHAQGK